MASIEKLFVALAKGGPGSERKVSLATAASVCEALKSLGHKVAEVDISGDDFVLPDGVDIVFNCIHGTFGEDGRLQGILDERGVKYTGAGRVASGVVFDKALTKKVLVEKNISTPISETIFFPDSKPDVSLVSVSIPCVVKPPREGSSVGVHIVKDEADLLPALEDVLRFDDKVLIEDFVDGAELTVGVLGDVALPIIEIRPPTDHFYDMESKYPWMNGGGVSSEYLCPAPLPDKITEEVQQLAIAAHQALGIEVYSRVDILLDSKTHRPYVIEANTIPGMTESSLLPKAAAEAGMSFPELCQKIIELSLKKNTDI